MIRVRVLVAAAALSALTALTLVAGPGAGATDPSPSDPLEQQIDADQRVATDEAVLGVGHVDLGPRFDDGEWTLMVHDDTRVQGSVWRYLDHTVIRVSDAALQTVPDDPTYAFLGVDPGTDVHVVPQTQDPDVVWLGWNTQDPEVLRVVDRGVTLALADVEGPGNVVVYLQDGGFGDPDVLWDSRSKGDQSLWIDVNTHTHANWVFTRPGVYLVSLTATATMVDGTEHAVTGTLRIAVGNDADPDAALAATPAVDAAGAAEPSGGSGAPEDGDADASADDGSDAVTLVVLAGAAALLVAGCGVAVWRGRRARAEGTGTGTGSDTGGRS